ncbi:MAG: hypothetical protein HY811_10990 [Planctomycetes bacterium]|nr:hypothetical protein [Planctomycetota bacterium]
MAKIISKVIIFASEFRELPHWLTDKLRSWKPEARDNFFNRILPLVGYKHAGKGIAGLGAMWLCGEKVAATYLRENDRLIKGGSVQITSLDNKMVFKSLIRNKIVEYGTKILDSTYDPAIISEGSYKLNEAVNQYLLPEFAPFKTDGESHIDFITEKLPSPAQPDNAIQSLGLDIQVSRI